MRGAEMLDRMELIEPEYIEEAEKSFDEKINKKSEDKSTMKFTRKFTKRSIILVAALCLLTILATAVFAAKIFSIKDAIVETPSSSDGSTESVISLAGFIGSREYMAASEWKEFKESYDPDGEILNQINDKDIDEKYAPYGAYSQEMTGRIDEIAAKYELSLHSGYETVLSKDWGSAVGEFVISGSNTPYSGYVYENGTFRYDGFFQAASGMMMDYQFSRSVKGVFDPVFLNIGNVDDYSEQVITTDSECAVAIAMSEYKSVLIAEFDSCFVCINVFGGTGAGITIADLEELANSFDYSVLATK